MRRLRSLGALMLLTAQADAADLRDYSACVDLVVRAPEAAEQAALAWADRGGGWGARHCRAMALVALGAERSAAEELVAIGSEAGDLPDPVRADMFEQAGEILLGLGAVEPAAEAVDRALNLAARPSGYELRARLAAERGDWGAALADLDRALAEGQPEPGRLILRASAKRRLGRLVAARDDAAWALELAPDDPAGWLEMGSIRAETGDRDGARAAFAEVLRLTPGGSLAEAARLRIQALETGG